MDQDTLNKLISVNPDILVDAFVKARGCQRAASAEKKRWTAKMEVLQTILLNKMHSIGVDQFSAMHHTVFKSVLMSATVNSRDEFINFVKATGRFELLDARASKDAVVAYRQKIIDDRIANGMSLDDAIKAGDYLPPGTNLTSLLKVNVRKGK